MTCRLLWPAVAPVFSTPALWVAVDTGLVPWSWALDAPARSGCGTLSQKAAFSCIGG